MNGRVLVVEDHALVAIGLQLALSARGWEVETTDGPTGADIIQHARQFQPQCVLLDIRLGEAVGSGIDLIRPLLATGAEVVMLTAETHRGVLASSVEAGAAGWIGKDVFLDDLEATLRDVLAGTSLIGRADRDAMIDELRIERAGRRRALEPFEQLTLREREVLAALVDGLSAEEIAETQFVGVGDGALADPRRAAEARRPFAAGRRRPGQPGRLGARGAPSRRRLRRPASTAAPGRRS